MNRLIFPNPLLLLVALSALLLTGCGGVSIHSGLPDHKTTLYLEPDSTVDFSVTGDTANDLSYYWQLVHYDSNNQIVKTRAVPASGSGMARRYTFTANDLSYFRTEVQVILYKLSSPLQIRMDSLYWEISKPVEKLGTQIPDSVFLRNSNDLPALSGISDVTGSVFLDAPAFRDVATLSGVTHIGGDLVVDNNSQIRTAHDLHLNPALVLDGNLLLRHNSNLRSLTGLESITALQNLTLENNRLLKNLTGLSALERVEGNLLVKNNLRLENLSGVSALSSIGGNLTLDNNKGLISTLGMESLQTIGGDLLLMTNSELSSLEGFAGLTQIGGTFTIDHDNPPLERLSSSLINLSGLDALTHAGAIRINESPDLESLQGLEQLTSVANFISLTNIPKLANLQALSNLSSIRTISLHNNPGLRNLQGLENVRNLENLTVYDTDAATPGITSLTGIENIGSIGNLSLSNNPLQDLAALDNVAITDVLSLHGNGITELPRMVDSELGEVYISSENITSLAGLNSITRLASLRLYENRQLTDLSALSGLVHVGQAFIILNNFALCQADADALLAQVQNAGGIGDSVIIDMGGNYGCN